MKDVAVITSVYGGYDEVQPPCTQQGVDVDWVLVTDDPSQAEKQEGKWRVVYDPHPDVPNFRAAKRPKFRPWDYTSAPASVWVDGTVRISLASFASEIIALTSDAKPIAAPPHDVQDCLYVEAEESTYLKKYLGEPLLPQMAHYVEMGHPKKWGLWYTTVLVRRHTDQIKHACVDWEQECTDWSSQDQVSFPYAMRINDLRPECIHPYQGNPNLSERWGLRQYFSGKHLAANDASQEYALTHRRAMLAETSDEDDATRYMSVVARNRRVASEVSRND